MVILYFDPVSLVLLIMRSSFFIFLAALFLFIKCRKDLPIVQTDSRECFDVPDVPAFGWQYKTRSKGLNATRGFYNPKNEEEVFFVDEFDSTGYYYRLIKWNRITNTKTILDSGVTGSPVVNKEGSVIYDKSDFKIYCIREGSGPIINSPVAGGGLCPYWIDNSDYYYCRPNTSEIMKSNLSGSLLDSVHQANTVGFFAKDSLLIHYKFINERQYIYLRNLRTNSDRFVVTSDMNGEHKDVYGFFLDKDNRFLFYYTTQQLIRFDLMTTEKKTIVEGCPMNQYLHYTVNEYNTKILATRILFRPLDKGTMYTQKDLVEFNMDGSGESVLKIE